MKINYFGFSVNFFINIMNEYKLMFQKCVSKMFQKYSLKFFFFKNFNFFKIFLILHKSSISHSGYVFNLKYILKYILNKYILNKNMLYFFTYKI